MASVGTVSLPPDVAGSAASLQSIDRLPSQLCYTVQMRTRRPGVLRVSPATGLLLIDFIFFFEQFRFTEKLRHLHREFPYTPHPVSPINMLLTYYYHSAFVIVNQPILIHYW